MTQPVIQAREVVRRLGGRATAAEIVRYSSRGALRAAAKCGDVRRVRRGVYTLPDLPPARAVAAAHGGVVSHTSAAYAYGLEVGEADDEVHVTVPRGGRVVAEPKVRVHWKPLPDNDVRGHLTSPLRTVLDCAQTLAFPRALGVADSALRRGLVEADELAVAAAALRGPGRGRCMQVARYADPRADNGFESALRGTLVEAGIDDLDLQHGVPLPGFTAHVDLADAARRIAIEADSYTYHASRVAFTKDCQRYDELGLAGWLVLRITWEQLAFAPEWVVGAVRRGRATRRRRAA